MEPELPEALSSNTFRRSKYLECLQNIEILQKREYIAVPYQQAGWTITVATIATLGAKWILDFDKLQTVIVFGSVAIIIGLALVTIAIGHAAELIQLRLHALSLSTANFPRTDT